jgi:hypothetical protein
MDNPKPTTRKGFMHKAGLAIAGVFTLSAASKTSTQRAKDDTVNELKAGPFKRIRPAQGAVQRSI